jgi:hypothetical protein
VTKLTAGARKHIAAKNFAGPDRSFPIEDMSHARNALSRVSKFGTESLKARVRAKVHAKYPEIGKQKKHGGKVDGHKAGHRMDRGRSH